MRLVDFQLGTSLARFKGLSEEEAKVVNLACFPVYESIRLWCKERKVEAPFRKIVVSIRDTFTASKWHGRVFVALGICEVNETVDPQVLHACSQDTEWLASLVVDGLDHIEIETGWVCAELRKHAKTVTNASPPCVHRFKKLCKCYKGTVCETWFEADVGHTIIKARFTLTSGEISEVVLVEEAGPIWMEDEYWVRSAVVLDGHYVIRDHNKWELARLLIPTV